MCDVTFFDQKKRLLPQKAKKVVEEGQEEEEEAPEEEAGDEEGGPLKEEFYPESVVVLKRTFLIAALQDGFEYSLSAFDFFRNQNLDLLLYDASHRTEFDIRSSLRVYVERVP